MVCVWISAVAALSRPWMPHGRHTQGRYPWHASVGSPRPMHGPAHERDAPTHAGSYPGNCSGMEEATGAPSSLADWNPKRLRASGRDGGTVMTESPSPLTKL